MRWFINETHECVVWVNDVDHGLEVRSSEAGTIRIAFKGTKESLIVALRALAAELQTIE